MINKIKQNPIKGLSILGAILFALAILCMLLPGIAYDGKLDGFNFRFNPSLFAFAFGGKVVIDTIADFSPKTYDMRVNGMTVFSLLLLAVALILVTILIIGLLKGKFTNKKIITLAIIIGVLVIASSIIILISKDSMIRYALLGKNNISDAEITKKIKELEQTGKFMIGLGAVLTPVMMILGATSIAGAVAISVKKAK